MVASKATVAEVYRIMRRYIADSDMMPLLSELREVKGNASFTKTVMLLAVHHARVSPLHDIEVSEGDV